MSDSDNTPFGFGRFVPGFDFLQNLAKGATSGVSAMPGMASWVAPTVSVEELDKRIGELKSVQFWLEQNSRALAATVQALEVQKMTLATLKSMNVAMGDIATAFGTRMAEGVQPMASAPQEEKPAPTPAPSPAPATAARAEPEPPVQSTEDAGKPQNPFAQGATGMVDPVQWWGSLTSQFQQIAANAMRDVSQHAATAPAAGGDMAKAAADMTSQFVNQGMKGAQEMTRQAMAGANAGANTASKPAARKTPARQPAAKKTAARNTPAKKAAAPRTRSAK